jgi:hypothetical protein
MTQKIALLAGNSSKNKSWIESVEEAIRDDFQEIYIQYYRHWQKEEGLIDLEKEAEVLVENVGGWEDFVIFAKSAGVVLALQNNIAEKIEPSSCFFVGFPYYFAQRLGIKSRDLLAKLDTETLIIQKSRDPAINADELGEIIEQVKNPHVTFEEIPGDKHHYGDLEMIRENILQLAR